MNKYPALKAWILVAFCGVWSCPSVLRAVEIVRNGRPVAVILVADDANSVAFEAAEELARVVEKATGARILTFSESELKTDSKTFPADCASKILVGDGNTVRKLGVDVSTLAPEGFVIKTLGRYLILAGRDERHTDWLWRGHRQPIYKCGTWYAVCTFLEDFLGARWLWPGELGEVVPDAKDIAIDDTDRREAPALAASVLRANCFYGGHWRGASLRLGLDSLEQFAMHQELVRWVDHQRLGTSLTLKSTEFGKRWLDAFAEEHPDWFALQPNGKRLLTDAAGRVRMCLSNPEVIDETVRRTVKYLDEHPSADAYGFSPSDVYGAYCVCEDCRAWGRTPSDVVAHHAAIVGQKVQSLRPDKVVAALAYHKYVAPPKTQVKFPNNVVLSYVEPNVFGYLCDEQHRKSVAYWDGWSKVAQKIIWRPNNFVSIVGVPRVYTTKLGADFRYFYRTNMIGTDFDRLSTNFAMDGLNYYVAARLT